MVSRCNKFVKSSTGPWRILQGPALTMEGNMTDIKKGLDLTYLRGQVIALMKLSANIQSTINKLEEEIKERENESNKL